MKKSIKRALAVVLAAVLVFSFAACSKNNNGSNNENKEKTKITVCLDWTPNTNHTGMYVALANGYYDEAGLMFQSFSLPKTVQQVLARQAKLSLPLMLKTLWLRASHQTLLCR